MADSLARWRETWLVRLESLAKDMSFEIDMEARTASRGDMEPWLDRAEWSAARDAIVNIADSLR